MEEAFPEQAFGAFGIVAQVQGFRELNEGLGALGIDPQGLAPVDLGPLVVGQIHAGVASIQHQAQISRGQLRSPLQGLPGRDQVPAMGRREALQVPVVRALVGCFRQVLQVLREAVPGLQARQAISLRQSQIRSSGDRSSRGRNSA